jgi:hypothetical protein
MRAFSARSTAPRLAVRWVAFRANSGTSVLARAEGVLRAPVRALGEPFVLNHAGGFGRDERAIWGVYQNVCAEVS